METLFLVLLIVFILGMIGGIGTYIFLTFDEKKVKEISTSWLHKMGKEYSKEEFEDTMFEQYAEIEYAKVNGNYNFLKDVVSDEEYNSILLEVKNEQEQEVRKVISNINKGFSKLINFKIIKNQEVAKLWIQYSAIEYTTKKQEMENENGAKEIKNVIISGSDRVPVYHEYILTFVKERATSESVLCPSCGNKTNLLLRSKCSICDANIVPKTKHWVLVNKQISNINKKN